MKYFLIFLLCLSLVAAEPLGNDPFEKLGGKFGELSMIKVKGGGHSTEQIMCDDKAIEIAKDALLDQNVLQPIVKMFEDTMSGLNKGIGYGAEEIEKDIRDLLKKIKKALEEEAKRRIEDDGIDRTEYTPGLWSSPKMFDCDVHVESEFNKNTLEVKISIWGDCQCLYDDLRDFQIDITRKVDVKEVGGTPYFFFETESIDVQANCDCDDVEIVEPSWWDRFIYWLDRTFGFDGPVEVDEPEITTEPPSTPDQTCLPPEFEDQATCELCSDGCGFGETQGCYKCICPENSFEDLDSCLWDCPSGCKTIPGDNGIVCFTCKGERKPHIIKPETPEQPTTPVTPTVPTTPTTPPTTTEPATPDYNPCGPGLYHNDNTCGSQCPDGQACYFVNTVPEGSCYMCGNVCKPGDTFLRHQDCTANCWTNCHQRPGTYCYYCPDKPTKTVPPPQTTTPPVVDQPQDDIQSCFDICAQEGLVSVKMDYKDYIMGEVEGIECVEYISVDYGMATHIGDCTCYPGQAPTVSFGPIDVCDTICGPLTCGDSTECAAGAASCTWGGWEWQGENIDGYPIPKVNAENWPN
ncbi:MAG: hypothetical protein ACE5FT_02515 [Candidatus Nanoarchaeia archaeon]